MRNTRGGEQGAVLAQGTDGHAIHMGCIPYRYRVNSAALPVPRAMRVEYPGTTHHLPAR
jgi:hypothetical protein